MAKKVALYINGKPIINSFTEVNKVVKRLEKELRGLTVGTEAWQKKAAEVKEARAAFEKIKNEINEVRNVTEKSANWFQRLGNTIGSSVLNTAKGFTLSNIFEGFLAKGKASIDSLLELSDEMSNVAKTTGLAKEEVKELWNEYDKLDTRTKKIELLKISAIAGRMGITDKAEIAAFTEEIDKAYVALGDSFSGGLDAVATKLGKIKGLFDDTAELSYSEAISKVGSALNELAANGTASEENISDFALRVGALPSALKPSIDNVLGLGAAFEQSGVDAQIAASGFSNFMSTAGKNIADFAYAMNMTTEEAKELINTKPEAFFLRFAEGMQGIDATQTSEIFQSLKLNSLEVQKAVGAASDNLAVFTDAMNLSGKAMDENISLQNEFNEVNNNAAAIWDKIKNTIDEFFTQGAFFEDFERLVQFIGAFVGVTDDADGTANRFRDRLIFLWKTVKVLTAVIFAYIATKKIAIALHKKSIAVIVGETTVLKAQTFWTNTLKGAKLAAAAAVALFQGNLMRATAAMRVFNHVTKLNPWGVLLSGIAAVVSYLYIFNDKVDEATESMDDLSNRQKNLNDVMEQAAQSAAKEISQLDELYKAATDVTKSTEERLDAVKKLKAEFPDYFSQISNEIIMNGKAEDSYKSLRQSILDSARASALRGKADEYMSKLIEIEHKIEIQKKVNKETLKEADKFIDPALKKEGYFGHNENTIKIGIEAEGQKELDNLLKKKKSLDSDYEYFLNESVKLETKKEDKSFNNRNLPDKENKGKDKKNRPAKKIDTGLKSALEAENKWQRELQKSNNEHWDEMQEITAEGLEKYIAKIEESIRREKQAIDYTIEDALQTQKEYNQKIKDLEVLKGTTKDANKIKEIEQSIHHYENALTKIDNVIEVHKKTQSEIEKKGNLQRQEVREEFLQKQIESEKKAFDDEQKDREIAFESELKQLDISEKEKEKKRKEFQKQELIRQAEFLQKLSATLKQGIESGDFTGLLGEDLFLTEEQKQAMIDKLREIGVEIMNINKAMGKGDENGDEKKSIGLSHEQTDLFGMSPSQWETFYKNIEAGKVGVEEMAATVMVLKNVWNSFYDMQNQREQAQLRAFEASAQRKKDALSQQLKEGYITQKEHDAKVKALEEEQKKRQAEMEYKQAKRKKATAVIDSIINTSLAISTTLGKTGFFGIPLAAIVGAMGAVQTAMILAQPLPPKAGYYKGGYTSGLGFKDNSGHEVAGVVHKNEWVAPAWMLKDPETANIIQYLEAKRNGDIAKFAQGGFTEQPKPTAEFERATQQQDIELQQLLYAALIRLNENLEKMDAEGIKAFMVADEKAAKLIQETIKKYERMKNKTKL